MPASVIDLASSYFTTAESLENNNIDEINQIRIFESDGTFNQNFVDAHSGGEGSGQQLLGSKSVHGSYDIFDWQRANPGIILSPELLNDAFDDLGINDVAIKANIVKLVSQDLIGIHYYLPGPILFSVVYPPDFSVSGKSHIAIRKRSNGVELDFEVPFEAVLLSGLDSDRTHVGSLKFTVLVESNAFQVKSIKYEQVGDSTQAKLLFDKLQNHAESRNINETLRARVNCWLKGFVSLPSPPSTPASSRVTPLDNVQIDTSADKNLRSVESVARGAIIKARSNASSLSDEIKNLVNSFIDRLEVELDSAQPGVGRVSEIATIIGRFNLVFSHLQKDSSCNEETNLVINNFIASLQLATGEKTRIYGLAFTSAIVVVATLAVSAFFVATSILSSGAVPASIIILASCLTGGGLLLGSLGVTFSWKDYGRTLSGKGNIFPRKLNDLVSSSGSIFSSTPANPDTNASANSEQGIDAVNEENLSGGPQKK